MARISADEINLHSPYKVIQVDDLSVRFITNDGVKYMVGFTPDAFIFDENGYDFFIANESEPTTQDPLVFQTVVCVILNLFKNASYSTMIYICATNDSKQSVRARLFQIWFQKADTEDAYTLQTYNSIDDGTEYFYGLILRKDNPDHDKLINIFIDFLSDF